MLQYVMQKTIIAFLQKPPVVSSDEIVIIVIYGSSEAELPSRISLFTRGRYGFDRDGSSLGCEPRGDLVNTHLNVTGKTKSFNQNLALAA